MATLYEVYRVDKRTGDKKRLGDVVASNNKIAWKKFQMESGWKYRSLKGKFLIIPQRIRAKYTVFKR